MRRRAYVGILAAVMAVATGAGVASATDDGSSSSELAEAQFRVYLLTHTDLRPSDITCTLPPTQDSGGEMVCFALVGRESIDGLHDLFEWFTAAAEDRTNVKVDKSLRHGVFLLPVRLNFAGT